jgi:N-methylhydantoinase A
MLSNVRHDLVRSRLEPLADLDEATVGARFEALLAAGSNQLRTEGFDGDAVRLRCLLDLRYAGQGYELSVPVDAVPLPAGALARLRTEFDVVHERRHGHAAPDQPLEVVSYRVEATGLVPSVPTADPEPANEPVGAARIGERAALFGTLSPEPRPVPVYDRGRLRPGHRFDGPAIVEQYDATTVVCPEQSATVDGHGNLLVELREDVA